MTMDRRLQGFASVRSALSVPLIPIQYLINLPVKWANEFQNFYQTHEHLVAENKQLKNEQLQIRAQLQRLTALESENTYLKALLKSSQQVKGKMLIAELLAISSQPFVNQVLLNKGAHDQVYRGQPVLDATGLMGQVIEVGITTSRVLLINDTRSGVSVQNVRNGMRSIAVGEGITGRLKLLYVPKTADIRVGDFFITSGLGDHYPAGYPVGRVISVTSHPGYQFSAITLLPSAHLDSSRQVLLVWNH